MDHNNEGTQVKATTRSQKAEKKLFALESLLTQSAIHLDRKVKKNWANYFIQLGQNWLDDIRDEEIEENTEIALKGLDVDKYV